MASSSSWMFSLKVILVLTAIVSIAVITKVSVPLIIDFAMYEVPLMWSTLLSWLKPPYLYLIINAIIITIAASLPFHLKLDDGDQSDPFILSKPQPEFLVLGSSLMYENEAKASEVNDVLSSCSKDVGDRDEDEFLISRSTWTPPQRTMSPELQTESHSPGVDKPLFSTRFGHRKPAKTSPEGGKTLRGVVKPKRQETLESTWKTITEGRHVPLTRHLKKPETRENQGHRFDPVRQEQSPLRSVATALKDRTNYDPASSRTTSPASGKLRTEASPSQDELTRRVEAFINKFNREMRLQREESLNQYMEMVGRGTH